MRKRLIQPIFNETLGTEYNPGRDGPLKEYIERHDMATPAAFKGSKHYEMLWDEGFLIPNVTALRLYWSCAGDDDYFVVKNREQIKGVFRAEGLSAKLKVHNVKYVLDHGLLFEARYMERNPVPRIPKKVANPSSRSPSPT